eukprot:5461259-Lingulodinium_polyedra.AAC.1
MRTMGDLIRFAVKPLAPRRAKVAISPTGCANYLQPVLDDGSIALFGKAVLSHLRFIINVELSQASRA